MRKQLLKSVMCLSLSAAMLFAEVPIAMAAEAGVPVAEQEGDSIDAAGEKLVNYTSIPAPTGGGYDGENARVFWDKVPSATWYHCTYKDTATGRILKKTTNQPYNDLTGMASGNYVVSIVALDTTGVYMGATNVGSDMFDSYVERPDYASSYQSKIDNSFTFYFYPASTPTEFSINIAEQADSEKTKSELSSIAFKEINENEMVFEAVNAPKLLDGEEIVWEYSNNPGFKDNKKVGQMAVETSLYTDGNRNALRVAMSRFTAGEICYVRARITSEDYNPGNLNSDELQSRRYGVYTPTVSCVVPKATLKGVNATVSGSKITLEPSLEAGSVTGYQYEKRIGKSYVTIAKQAGNSYTDKGLTANKAYKYRVRGYSYNKYTRKTTYTDWQYVNATTWGASLKVKASAESSTSVKLSWNKVSGASGYEIYRINTNSTGVDATGASYDDSFGSYNLVKTITKSSTTSYTDKKLSSGASYAYIVRAYRTAGKDKSYINGSVSIKLAADGFRVQDEYYTTSGSYKVTWQKMTGIKGFKIEKYNNVTKKYALVKTLSKTSTNYTFPKVAPGQEDIKYRVRPYTSSKVYTGYEVTVRSTLGTVKNVKASATSDGIKVTWSSVAGADYYRVLRYKENSYSYDKTTKNYRYYGSPEVVFDAGVSNSNYYPDLGETLNTDYVGTYKNSNITVTSVLDRTIPYVRTVRDAVGKPVPMLDAAGQPVKNPEGRAVYQTEEAIWNQGPEMGVTYNYVVVAYAKAPNGQVTSSASASSYTSKQASAMMTAKSVKKVSKITSVKSSKAGQATISYKKVSGADGYAVYRATSKKGTYVLVGTTTKSSYTDTDLTSKKTYYYKVAAIEQSEAKEYIYSSQTGYKSVKVK